MDKKYVLLLGFVSAIAIIYFFNVPYRNLALSESRQPSGSLQTKVQLEFKDEMGGLGTTKDGNPVSFHVYRSPDGVKVSTYIVIYPSVELAQRAMVEKVDEASSVITRGSKSDRDGKPIGERVVLTSEKSEGERLPEPQSFICWTTGPRLHWIQSKSLKHALAFEKTLDPTWDLFGVGP